MRARASLVLVVVLGCGQPDQVEMHPAKLSQSGGDLLLRGEFSHGGGVVVLIGGVPAQAVVRESVHVIRARVPPLPRTGTFEVELLWAGGERTSTNTGLVVSAPALDVRP